MTDAAISLETKGKSFRGLSRQLLISAATLAIVIAGNTERAAAQSFKGTPTVTQGGATVSNTAGKTTVNINAPITAINWQPTDTTGTGTILFQSAGTTTEFNSINFADFAVLNRILPVDSSGNPVFTRPVRFDGTVNSTFGAGTSTTAGSIWFYTPGGIILGSTSAFNVGSLVLSTSDISPASLFTGTGGTINFTGTPNTASAITLETGAQINALINGSSYVAMVAPRIIQGGIVTVDGSVAYVAAEQADITINNGLFDIGVLVGSGDANGVVHTGTTTGPSSTPTPAGTGNNPPANPDAQAIYMVAVPKNAAMTMLLSGNIGYQAAASAAVVNGSVILSAGANVAVGGTAASPTIDIDTAAPQNFDANIEITRAAFSSSVTGFAGNNINVTAAPNGNVIASNTVGTQDINLLARNNLTFSASDGGIAGANGNLSLSAGNILTLNATSGGNIISVADTILRAGTNNAGGTININVDQTGVAPQLSGLIVGGNLTADVSARGADDFFTIRNNGNTGIGQDASVGDININVTNGGDFIVTGTTRFDATAQGGKGEVQNGAAQGGNISVTLAGTDSVLDLQGGAFFDTRTFAAQSGKTGGNGPGAIGSDSISGDVSLDLLGGTMSAGFLSINASAEASPGSNPDILQSNDATAGNIDINVSGGSHDIGTLFTSATSNPAESYDALGMPVSGKAGRSTTNLSVMNLGSTLNTSGISINAGSIGSTAAPSATDSVTIQVLNTGTGAGLIVSGNIFVNATTENGSINTPTRSGSVSLLADNGDIIFDDLNIDTSSSYFDEGKDFQAGDINLIALNGGAISGSSASLYANAFSGDGGDGIGGNILLNANNGSIGFSNFVIADVSGVGGVGLDLLNPLSLGSGQGGSVRLLLEGAAGSMSFNDLFLLANGSIQEGGEGTAPEFEGDGGTGSGGDIIFDILGGTFSANNIDVSADGRGGFGGNIVNPPVTTASASIAAAGPGFVSAGNGGAGSGGNVTFNLNGGNATVTNLSVTANGLGGDGAFGDYNAGTNGGAGGNGTGGTATFNAISGTLNVTNLLSVEALGNAFRSGSFLVRGGNGGFGNGTNGGAGGNGFGGTATFNMNGTAIIDAGSVLISSDGFGGFGGDSQSTTDIFNNPIQGGIGGGGGNGTGGSAVFNNTSGTVSFGGLTVQSLGFGGDGGGNFGLSTGQADNDGGDGGLGTGGTATINLNQDDVTFPTYTVDASATGGNGGTGLNSGDGGNAVGGVAALNINNANIMLDDPAILANATGGNGGFVDGPGGQGGDGGNATGGTARLEVTGANGYIPVNFILMQSDGLGGNGGDGGGEFTGGIAGNGGNGGDATGGRSEMIARAGGEIDIQASDFNHSSSGTGGNGGAGGNIDMISGGTAGDGGDGGNGTGGTPYMLAQGGTINAQDVGIDGLGFAGIGGAGGTDFTVTLGAVGIDGIGNGGLAIIEVQEGSPGIINFGPTTIEVSGAGGTGGRIEITDTSTDPAGLITFDDLVATALGLNNPGYTGFYLGSNSGAITVNGNVFIDVSGNAEFAFANDGRLLVSGGMNVNSGTDSILVSHINNAANLYSIDVGSAFNAFAALDFSSGVGSRIRSGSDMFIGTGANIFAADLTAVDHMTLQAGQNAELVDGLLTASGVGNPPIQIRIDAGVTVASVLTYDPNYNATLSGTVVSAGNVIANAGGNIFVRSMADVSADDRVQLRSGDDIIIESGASLAAAVNPTTALNAANPFLSQAILEISAGALAPFLSSPILTPISSIVTAGDLYGNASAVVMTANAIDGLGGTITASSISADILNAPSNAQIALSGQSNDNGLLSAQCVEGNVCLGELFADNIVQIGQNSPNDVVQAVIEGGTVAANSFLLTTRRDIRIGTAGAASSIAAGNQIALTSVEGNIDLQDSGLTSDLLQISAGTGSLLGSGSLTSANDIGITVGNNLSAASIDTGGELTTVANIGGALEGSYSLPGNMNVGTLTVGAGDVNYTAANFTFGQINVLGSDIILITPGALAVGDTNGAANIDFDANNMTLGTIDASNTIALNAATAIGFASLSAGGAADLTAGNITGGTITAGAISASTTGSFQSTGINGSNVLISSGQNATFNGNTTSATTFDVRANQLATFNGIVSAQNIDVSSDNIAIGAAGRLGVIGTTQNVDLSNSAGAQMTLGGSGVATGYSLSGAEMARIFANNIDISWTDILATTGAAVAPPAGGFAGPNIVLDSFTLISRATNAAGNLAANGLLSINSPGTMQIVGAVGLGGAGANNSMQLNAGQSIQIISGQGSVGINDGAGGLAGTLAFDAQNIYAASNSAINDIAGLTNPTLIDQRLASNDGNISDTGMISAATVNFEGASNIYVQNTGTSTLFRDRRGITANAINIDLVDPNGHIVINGRIAGNTGFATGLDAIPLLNINGSPSQQSTGFNTLSTMNGCQITAIGACRQRENPISVTETGINEPLNPDQGTSSQFPTTLIELKEFETFGYPPLIDEPVTGSGNDDLWPVTCSGNDQDICEPLISDTQ